MPLPNFLVIGAPKSGTTSLDRYLGQHPQIYMSPVKEPQYFRPIRSLKTTVEDFDDYRALFDGVRDERAIGEVSPFYVSSVSAADRIREMIPDVRLVAIVRNPVERAFSDYSMLIEKGRDHVSFDEAIADELAPESERRGDMLRNYVKHGLYGEQLASYYERFERDHIHVMLFEDLRRDGPGLMHGLYEFLEVDTEFEAETSRVYNATTAPPRHPRLNRLVRRAQNHDVQRFVPRSLRKGVRTLTSQSADRMPELSASARARLVEYYRPDVRTLEQLLGRDLSGWLT